MPQLTKGLTVWLTGLPGSGKTTSADSLQVALQRLDYAVCSLDGDVLREGISAGLGFSEADRAENVRRAGDVALLLASQGLVVVVSLVSPRRAWRDAVRQRHEAKGLRFLEVHVAAPLAVCERRDPKALYRRARAGDLANMTGLEAPYEPPERPELVLQTHLKPAETTGRQLLDAVLAALGR